MSLQQLKSVIQAAVPREIERAFNGHNVYRLSDVLLALHTSRVKAAEGWVQVDVQGQFISLGEETGLFWDLANDSLDAQSPETIQFLINLLCK